MGISPYGITLRELCWMALGKAAYQGATQHGGSGESSGTEKMEYNPTMLKMFVAKTVDAGEAELK